MATKKRRLTQPAAPRGLPLRWLAYAGLGMAAVVLALGLTGALSSVKNWWALLIFIPALLLLLQAALYYRAAGRLERESVGRLVLGLFIALVGGLFMQEENIGEAWIAFLTAAVASFLFVLFRRRKK